MININDILRWKQEFGEVYQVSILDEHYVFHALGREEYKEIIMMDLDLGDFQEAICFNAIIYPNAYDFSKGIAGIAEVLSDAILDVSGLHVGQAGELLLEYRTEMMNYDYMVDCIIHEAFPEYSLETIATWPVRKTMFYLSRAEWILQTLKGVPIENLNASLQQMQMEEYQEDDMQQEPEPVEQSQPNPFQREIRKELIGYVEQPEPQPKPKPKEQPEGGVQSEEELLAMLAGTGAKIANPTTNLDDEVKPELNWFSHMDELKGDFD